MSQATVARDVMTLKVVTVRPDTSVRDIALTLLKHRISGVPVVDDTGALLGMVTEGDLILRVSGPHLPPHIELLGGVIYLDNPLALDEKLRKAMGVTADEIMTRDLVTVDAGRPLREVADVMIHRKLNRLPVVEGKRLVGIITRHDLISTILDEPEG
jgi:CBS domain-containing protein